MGAAIENFTQVRQITPDDQLLQGFHLKQYRIMELRPGGAIVSLQVPILSRNQSTMHKSRQNTSKFKIQVTYKPSMSTRSCCLFRSLELEVKRVTVSAQNEAKLLQCLGKLQLPNGKIQTQLPKNAKVLHLCGYYRGFQGFVCGEHSNIDMVFQHARQVTLHEQITLRAEEIQRRTHRHNSVMPHASIVDEYSFKMGEILKVIKFLLETCEQLLEYPGFTGPDGFKLPKISLEDVIVVDKLDSSNFKYRNPVDSVLSLQRQTLGYYDSNVRELLVCVGLCALSMCTLEDCNRSCCNLLGQICASVVEDKLQQIRIRFSNQISESLGANFSYFVESLVFQGTEMGNLSVNEAKSMCNKVYLEMQRKFRQLGTENDTSQNIFSDLSTSVTINQLFRKKIFEKHQKPASKQAPASQSFGEVQKQNQEKTIKIQNNMTSISAKLQNTKGWSIHKSSAKRIEPNTPLALRVARWNEGSEPQILSNITNHEQVQQLNQRIEIQGQDDWLENLPQFQDNEPCQLKTVFGKGNELSQFFAKAEPIAHFR